MTTFVARDWESISSDLLAWVQGSPDAVDGIIPTDIRVGSLELAHLEAVAIGMEDLYYRFSQAIPEAISESCYRAFGFGLRAGTTATGAVTFGCYTNAGAHVPIPSGTIVMTRGSNQFLTTEAGTIEIGSKISDPVPVVAVESGTTGNVPAGSITVIPYPIHGVDFVSNITGTAGGKGIESDADRGARFAKFILTLPRGTPPALEYAAMSCTGVVGAKCVDPFSLPTPPPLCPYAGLTWLWVDTGQDGVLVPSVEAAIRLKLNGYTDTGGGRRLEGWKSAGIRVDLFPVEYVPVKVAARITVLEGARTRFATEMVPMFDAITLQHFSDLGIGDTVHHNALLVALATSTPDIVDVELKIWVASEDEPATYAPADIVLVDPGIPTSIGLRATLVSGPVVEGGETVTHPRWCMA